MKTIIKKRKLIFEPKYLLLSLILAMGCHTIKSADGDEIVSLSAPKITRIRNQNYLAIV